MQKLLTDFIDALFPPSVEAKLVRKTTSYDLEKFYRPGSYNKVIYLSNYAAPLIKASVIENKFHYNKKAAELMGCLLDKWLSERKSKVLLVPVPLSKKRQRMRGHNQVETILQLTKSKPNYQTTLLKRHLDTKPQSELPKTLRKNNVEKAFTYKNTLLQLGEVTEIVLVDDVVTTGETLGAARATLAPHLPPHIKLTCLAIAH